MNESRRHDLYLRLEQVLGREEASILMEHLPPVPWTDMVTRRDLSEGLSSLEARLDARIDARLADSTRVIVMWMVGVMVPLFAALFTAVVTVR